MGQHCLHRYRARGAVTDGSTLFCTGPPLPLIPCPSMSHAMLTRLALAYVADVHAQL